MAKLIMIIFSLTLLLGTSCLVNGDFINSLKDTVNDVSKSLNKAIDSLKDFTCVIKNTDKFNECAKIMDQFNDKNKKIEDNEVKDYCCAFHNTKICTESVADEVCGAEAAKVVTEFMNKFSLNVMPDDCEKYDSFLTCSDQTLLIIGAVVAGILFLGIISCLFCCLKRMCC